MVLFLSASLPWPLKLLCAFIHTNFIVKPYSSDNKSIFNHYKGALECYGYCVNGGQSARSLDSSELYRRLYFSIRYIGVLLYIQNLGDDYSQSYAGLAERRRRKNPTDLARYSCQYRPDWMCEGTAVITVGRVAMPGASEIYFAIPLFIPSNVVASFLNQIVPIQLRNALSAGVLEDLNQRSIEEERSDRQRNRVLSLEWERATASPWHQVAGAIFALRAVSGKPLEAKDFYFTHQLHCLLVPFVTQGFPQNVCTGRLFKLFPSSPQEGRCNQP
jgi:hypothetical protein